MTKARDNADNWAADITGVTAGTGITGGGTSGTVTVTNSLLTTIDAAGDLLYGTGADAASRLAIGTAGQVLQVNSGATAPEWATATSGGMTLIASGSVTSGTSVGLTSIPQTYTYLSLEIYDLNRSGGSNNKLRIYPNNDTTGSWNLTSQSALNTTVQSTQDNFLIVPILSDLNNQDTNHFWFNFYNYTSTDTYQKHATCTWGAYAASQYAAGAIQAYSNGGISGAYTSIYFDYGGNTFSSCQYKLYGVK